MINDKKLMCPHCKNVVSSGNVNTEKLVAKCPDCQSVFSFAKDKDYILKERSKINVPDDIEIWKQANGLRISYKWNDPVKQILWLEIAFWILIFVLGIFMLNSGNSASYSAVEVLVFVIFGCILAYLLVSIFINHTQIDISQSQVSIQNKPLITPFSLFNKQYRNEDIEQVYCHQYKAYPKIGKPVFAYSVTAITKDKSTHDLVRGIQDRNLALYIEQEIEEQLGISNRYVQGEI